MRRTRGSMWRKWDLHVHTPLSLVQNYGGDKPDVWERFFKDLESLPAEFRVIGINDYIFLEGYRRVLRAKAEGRLSNLELILPVVELRIDRFGGTGSPLRRVNVHVIFSDEVDADVIEQQFLNALSSMYVLDPTCPRDAWKGVPTREALADLGTRIIASAPPEKAKEFDSPLQEGFNALTVSLDQIYGALDKQFFREKVLTAVGKAEWAAIRWQDGAIADKKTIINRADFVFTAAADGSACERAAEALTRAQVNSRLLDCSDAHTFSTSMDKDRIGNCLTWINADTSFEGLKQARNEPQARIYLGERPDLLRRLNENPTKYLDAVRIRRRTAAAVQPWFDGTEIKFNAGLIAVIGNRGSGKSAIVDVLGLLADSQRQSEAAFLTEKRFCHPSDNKAQHFIGSLVWSDGTSAERRLDEVVAAAATERITYVPQRLFDSICNELESSGSGQFEAELKRVIYSHVDESDKLGFSDLDGLIEYRARETKEGVRVRHGDLSRLNSQIVHVERQLGSEHRQTIENALVVKRQELQAHEAQRPKEVPAPGTLPNEAAEGLVAELEAIAKDLATVEREQSSGVARQGQLKRELAALERVRQRVGNLRERFKVFEQETDTDLLPVGLRTDDLVSLRVDLTRLEQEDRSRREALQGVEQQLGLGVATPAGDPGPSLPARRKALAEQQVSLQAQLDLPQQQYRSYQVALAAWESARTKLVGDAVTPDTLAGLEAALKSLDSLPERLTELKVQRRTLLKEIHQRLCALAELYRKTYQPVQRLVEDSGLPGQDFGLALQVGLVDRGFSDDFLERFINRQRAGSFMGVDEGAQRVRRLLAETDFNDETQAIEFPERVVGLLSRDERFDSRSAVKVSSQLKQQRTEEELYDFLFGLDYLEVRLGLRMGDRELRQLSPGEKGALLLMFYLLVDPSDRPLVIDQPEENLDNQTIFSLLVPTVRKAKKRRQIVIVTHNPNLAVVCDADQVIYASHTREGETRITYEAGALENPRMNRHVVNILEGTKVAFDNRRGKYQE